MGKHVRIIEKSVYEYLIKKRDEIFADLFNKYKTDPDYTRYESHTYNPYGMEFNYCRFAAESVADEMTIGREMKLARDTSRSDPDFKREDCGCCHNATITVPYENSDGNWQIDIEVS